MIVSVTAMGSGGDPSITEALAAAVKAAFDAPVPPQPVEVRMTSPEDAPESDLLIRWENGAGGLIQVFLLAPPHPPELVRLEVPPTPWDTTFPGNFPLYLDPDRDLNFAGQVAAALIEAAIGASEQAGQRIVSVQEDLPNVTGSAAAINQAILSFALARIRVGQGDPIGALARYSEAIRIRDDFAAAYVGRGSIYLRSGDTQAALDAYDTAINLAPEEFAARYDRVLAYLASNNTTGALADAEFLVARAPQAWSTNLRGIVYYQLADYESALADFELAGRYAPEDPIPFFNQSLALNRLGEYGQALVVLDALIEVQPDSPLFHLYLGDAFQATGDIEQAEHAFSQAIALDSAYIEAYLRRGRLRVSSGDYAGAAEDARQALGLAPQSGLAFWVLADALLGQEDFAGARDAYTTALNLGLERGEVYAGRAWALHRLNFRAGALEDYQRALTLGFSDPLMLNRMGFALYDTGRYEDALDAMLAAVNAGLDTAEAHAGLSLALDANIRRDEAEQQYQRALELDDGFGKVDFLAEQPLWSQAAITRAVTILRRLGIDPYSQDG